MSSKYRDFASEDYRPRANKRGSRPRTKDRPDYSGAAEAMVVGVDRGRYRLVPADWTPRGPASPADASPAEHTGVFTGVRASLLRKRAIVPGDWVKVTGDTSGEEGTLARIVDICPRTTILRRSADDTDTTERVIVANATQVVVVTSTAEPEPSWGLLDRTLIAAYDAGIRPVIAVTKTDLRSSEAIRRHLDGADVEIVDCGFRGPGAADRAQGEDEASAPAVDTTALEAVLAGEISVLIGHSGVGKSTLTNAVIPHAGRATGHVNDVTGRGRHTSSSARCLVLPAGGWVVDTPGVRSFGLAHVEPERVLAAFADLAPGSADCPKGCTHLADSTGCALDAWVAEGRAGEAGAVRLASLRRLLGNLGSTTPWSQNPRS